MKYQEVVQRFLEEYIHAGDSVGLDVICAVLVVNEPDGFEVLCVSDCGALSEEESGELAVAIRVALDKIAARKCLRGEARMVRPDLFSGHGEG